ncbi:SDR family NAD(P)-dependent oxidoreductase [Ammoniphilus sp. 3BR4]|uniref:SDR family NAD(P)-dependent oxidoreductase n=1 Tax=Ammoniphilus sp. 3BR4 TaxID=3158265 RepID=UPI0034656C39
MGNKVQRVVLVTGASQGLGKAIAEKLLSEGKKVAFLSRSQRKLDMLREQHLDKVNRDEAVFMAVDVSDHKAMKQAIHEILSKWGRIDILVNNAGIRTQTAIEDMTLEEWDQIMSTNLASTFFVSQTVMHAMKEQKWGRIINMSSIGGQDGPLTSSAAYCASKAGQLALTKVFARSLAPYGITVNAVAPAAVRTPEMDNVPADKLEKMIQTIPIGRVGEAEEVADLVSYLASENGGFVTGATFDINGGRLMR